MTEIGSSPDRTTFPSFPCRACGNDTNPESSGGGGQVYMTSSFQTQSVPLLHIVASSGLDVSVLFIDTGYHFAETYAFVDAVSRQLGLDVRWIGSSAPHAPLPESGARATCG